jgi:GT2 family glycosyltransferase
MQELRAVVQGRIGGTISIVVATRDRPDDLRQCLSSLAAQETSCRVEIIVVDNNPASGLTPPVVAEFSGVKLAAEQRRGLAYARNKGFLTSRGEIAIATDDDVLAPPDWIEKLLAPFANPEVMVVTGNVLPWELETEAQRLFEAYGGLGRGAARRVVNGEWFKRRAAAPPTWSLGATANAAFRSSIFSHPRIGLMNEALGPGMPSGVGEDTYLFYKVLKAGYTIVYEPAAWVWHKHRREMAALRRQVFNYSKGHVAYHLTTLLGDGDWRAVINLAALLPVHHLRRALHRLLGRSDYPLSLILLEAAGNLAGPWALWQSRRRVRREGKSEAIR